MAEPYHLIFHPSEEEGEEGDVAEDATTLPTRTKNTITGTCAIVADLMYQGGTTVPRALGNVAWTRTRRDIHAGMRKSISTQGINLAGWRPIKHLFHALGWYGENDY